MRAEHGPCGGALATAPDRLIPRCREPRANGAPWWLLRAALVTTFLAVCCAASLATADPTTEPARDAGKTRPPEADGSPPEADGSPPEAEGSPPAAEGSLFNEAAGPLALSEEQRLRLERISAESQEYGATIRAELKAARDDLNSLLAADEPEIVAVMDQAEEIGRLETRMRKHHLATLLSLRAVLTPTQRENLVEVFQNAAARRRALEADANKAAAAVTADATP